MRWISIFLTLLLTALLPLGAAHSETLAYAKISLDKYLEIVKENNALIRSGKLDVQSASANKESQSLYNFNPSVSYTKGSWNARVPSSPNNSPQSNTYALNFNIEGWGKRSARANLAQSQITASNSQLKSTSANIETTALYAYIDTLRLALLDKSYGNALSKLASIKANPKLADSVGFLQFYQGATQKDLMFSSLSLLNYSGKALKDLPYPIGNLNYLPQNLIADNLVEQAQSNRVDVVALQTAIDVADKNVTLTNQNRNIDIAPFVSQTRTPQYVDSGATYNAQNSMTFGITIPIPVNNFLQTADIVQAANQKLQQEMQLEDLKVQIRVQVLQAFMQYSATKDMLANAQAQFDGVVKNPNKDPVQAVMDIRDKEGSLLDAKTNHLKALIYLWRQSGNYTVPNL